MSPKKVLILALTCALSMSPAAATDLTVTIDPGNPNSDTPKPPTENVRVVLTGPDGQREARTSDATVTFTTLAEGDYIITFPEVRELQAPTFSVPAINPETGTPYDVIDVTTKFVPVMGSSDSIATIITALGIPSLVGLVILGLLSAGDHGGDTPGEPLSPPRTHEDPAPVESPSFNERLGDALRDSLLASTGANVWWVFLAGLATAFLGFIIIIARQRKERHNKERNAA